MNLSKYYDKNGKPTHNVFRVLLSFHNTEKPWMERVQKAADSTIMFVPDVELHFISGTLKKNDYSTAVVWVMIPVQRDLINTVGAACSFTNYLGIDGIIATGSFFDLDFLTSRNIDQNV